MPETTGRTVGPVVRAEHQDVDWVLKLQYLCYQSEAQRYNKWDLDALTQSSGDLSTTIAAGQVLVVRTGNARPGAEVVGSVRTMIDSDVAHIGRLVVHPRFQRRGLGSTLLTAALVQLRSAGPALGVTHAEAYTGHRSVEFAATYLKCGFVEARCDRVSDDLQLVHYRASVDEDFAALSAAGGTR